MSEPPFGENIIKALEDLRVVARHLRSRPGFEWDAEVLERCYNRILDNLISEIAWMERQVAEKERLEGRQPPPPEPPWRPLLEW